MELEKRYTNMVKSNNFKFKADHFEDISELIETCNLWTIDDDYDAYCRFFDMGAMQELISFINFIKMNNEQQKKTIIELEAQNRYYKDMIKRLVNSKELTKGQINTYISFIDELV